jgi:hypothetical protein
VRDLTREGDDQVVPFRLNQFTNPVGDLLPRHEGDGKRHSGSDQSTERSQLAQASVNGKQFNASTTVSQDLAMTKIKGVVYVGDQVHRSTPSEVAQQVVGPYLVSLVGRIRDAMG